jgi:recombination protein RecA
MSNLAKLRKQLEKKNFTTKMNDPDNWISTGNALLNYRLTGRFDVGIPNRRTFLYWGESGTGKTFLASTACKEAQDQGYMIVYVDSEESISEDYMEKIGIDLSPDKFMPILVDTIEQCTAALAELWAAFDKDDKFILVIDSVAGMLSEKELKEFKDGDTKGDLGQLAKKTKLLVKNINKQIAKFDAFCILITHAYQNQDILNGAGPWICTGGKGFQFFPSMAVMLEKRKLKEAGERINGVLIRGEVNKTRFTAPMQRFELKVPYDKGIDFTEGMLDALLEAEIVTKNGAWYSYEFNGETRKFQGGKFDEHFDDIMNLYNKKELIEDIVEETDSSDVDVDVE